MTHVVAEPCFNCKYTDCVVVCPVECFYEGEAMLFIHPDECIDCEACVPECPPVAIFHEDNLPAGWADYVALNAEMVPNCPGITEKQNPMGPPIDVGSDDELTEPERRGEGKHFIAYHNTEKMGNEFTEDDFSVGVDWNWSTGKEPAQFVGGRIWCISGSGKPRRYLLHGWFSADAPGCLDGDDFQYLICGKVGGAFAQPILLNNVEWFPRFLKSQSNFSLGVQLIKDEFVSLLDALCQDSPSPDVDQQETNLVLDGKPVHAFVKLYRRNPVARRKCIEHWGTICNICNHDFKVEYGPEVDEKVHVHHLRTLAEIGEEHQLDPVNDLRPVCPNCHAALHSRDPIFSIDELKEMRRRQQDQR